MKNKCQYCKRIFYCRRGRKFCCEDCARKNYNKKIKEEK